MYMDSCVVDVQILSYKEMYVHDEEEEEEDAYGVFSCFSLLGL